MAELIVVQGAQEERLLFEGGSPSTPGTPGNVGVRDWFKDKFWGENDAGSPGRIDDIAETIRLVAGAVTEGFSGLATDKADGGTFSGAEVQFGIKVSAEGNTFVTKAGMEANLTVKFVWDFT